MYVKLCKMCSLKLTCNAAAISAPNPDVLGASCAIRTFFVFLADYKRKQCNICN